MSGFSKSSSPKNQGETGRFAEDKTEIKDKGTDGKVIVLLNRRNISSLFA